MSYGISEALDKKNEVREKKIGRIKGILAKHGIKMDVYSCGCCNGPWVTFIYRDQTIMEDGSDVCFDMTEEAGG